MILYPFYNPVYMCVCESVCRLRYIFTVMYLKNCRKEVCLGV